MIPSHEKAAPLSDLLARFLPIGLVLLMFVVGLRLDLRRVRGVFAHPRVLGVGLGVQLVALPGLAVLLATLFGLSPALATGLILVAAAPGGITSNYIAHLARADLALSTAMTLVTTALASATIPTILYLTGAAQMPGAGGVFQLSIVMLAVALVPLGLGLTLRTRAGVFSAKLLAVLEPGSRMVFAALVAATFWQNWEAMTAHAASVGAAVLTLNLGALAVGFLIATIARVGPEQRAAIIVEASMQNVAVALFVAGSVLRVPEVAIPALIYALVMNFTALAQIAIGRRARITAM